MAFFGKSRKKVLYFPSPPRWTRPNGSRTSVRGGHFQGRRACAHTHRLDFESAVNGELIHLQVECIFSQSWHEQQPYSEGMKALFDADLQAAFRAKGNFDPSSRPPAAREPIHLVGRDPRWNRQGFFFFIPFFHHYDRFLSCVSPYLKKKKKKSSQVVRNCRLIGHGDVEY